MAKETNITPPTVDKKPPYSAVPPIIEPDTTDLDPTAYVDDNSIVYLGNDIHTDMQYAPLHRTIGNNTVDYVLLEAYNGNTKVASTTLSINDPCIHIIHATIDLDLLSIVRDKMGLGNGQYDIHVSVYRNYIYSIENADTEDNNPGKPGTVQIEEISPTRNEIRVKATLPAYNISVDNWINKPIDGHKRMATEFDYEVVWPAILRDPKRNIAVLSTNWQNVEFDDEAGLDHIVFRLTEPLPRSIKVGNKLQVTRDVVSPYVVPVLVDLESSLTSEYMELRGPNFKAVDVKDKPSRGTLFETWDSIVGSDIQTKQRIIDKYISGSDSSQINIDYRKYDNFIHFSSAEERLKNFKYKLELIELYSSQSANVSTLQAGKPATAVTGSSEFIQNKAMYDSKKVGVISGFDDYEKYLYYESHSTETTTYGIFPAATWPKESGTKPYSIMHTTGSEAVSWYASQLSSASIYDETNLNILRNTIPAHILQDNNSDNYVTFVDMIGQHFDTLYNYISHIPNVMDREESIYDGLSKDLIYDAAKSFGWNLQSGFDTSKLWEYVLGTDETGSYDTATDQVREESYSHEDIEKQTWKRIVNNIPYLLKTKGTARGIKALLNTYGIPTTILQIQEFGGPAPQRITDSRREIEKFSYALDFSGSRHIETEHQWLDTGKEGTSFTETSTGRYPSMYEFRFDVNENNTMHLVSTEDLALGTGAGSGVGRFEVILEHSSSASATSSYYDYGRLVFKISSGSAGGIQGDGHVTMSTEYAPFYDNDWWNVSFGVKDYTTGEADKTYTNFEIRYAKIGEHADSITHSGSAEYQIDASNLTQSFNQSWGNSTILIWGGTGSNDSNATYLPFSGSMQEIRGWAEYIGDSAFHQHALSPISIVGDTVQMGYNDLIMRHPLGTDNRTYNHSTITALQPTSSLPNVNNRAPYAYAHKYTDATFVNWPDAVKYSNKSETYYVNVPNTVGLRPHDNKVRIEDNTLSGTQLAHDRTYEVSPFDTNALDSDDVTVAFSPQEQIDTDISMQFGGFRLDDYIGDPRDKYSKEYKSLHDTRNLYFKKYDDKYNIWAFIRLLSFFNTGLFKQIEGMLPARADAIVGLIIRPSMLERIKMDTAASMSFENMMHTGSIERKAATISGHTVSQSFNNTDFIIHTTTINTGVRASNPGHDRYRKGSEYQYGNYTGSGVQQFVNLYGDGSRNTISVDASNSGSFQQHYYSKGFKNLIINGCKMSSEDFNEPSADTVDGAPVVEFTLTNPNRLKTSEASPTKQAFKKKNTKGGSKGGSISEILIR